MEFHHSELDHDIQFLKLIGTLDIVGVGAIETRFTAYCSGENARILVDLSEVEFLASIGIRLLMLNAKSIASRGGRMVLFCPEQKCVTCWRSRAFRQSFPFTTGSNPHKRFCWPPNSHHRF